MITIFHGDHHIQSRTALTQAIAAAQVSGRRVSHLEVKNLEAPALTAELQAQSLFAEPRTVVIEELHSLMKSKRKEELIRLVSEAANDQELDIILWEKKQITATEMKKFPTAKTQLFVPTRSMFAWLNALSGQQNDSTKSKMITLLQSAIESDGEQFCFAMLMRQIRLMMEAKEGSSNPALFKMASQAKLFTWQQLFFFHKQVLLIDEMQKTSGSVLSMASQLELLMVTL